MVDKYVKRFNGGSDIIGPGPDKVFRLTGGYSDSDGVLGQLFRFTLLQQN